MKKDVFSIVKEIAKAKPAINLTGISAINQNIPNFIADFSHAEVMGMTIGENYFNLSIQVRIPGMLTLDANRPAHLPTHVIAYIWRNVAVIRDGELVLDEIEIDTSNRISHNSLICGQILPILSNPGKQIITFKGQDVVPVNETTADSYGADYASSQSIKAIVKLLHDYESASARPAYILGDVSEDTYNYYKSIGLEANGMIYSPNTSYKSRKNAIEVVFKNKYASISLAGLRKKIEEGKELDNHENKVMNTFEIITKSSTYDECERIRKVFETRFNSIKEKLFVSRMNMLNGVPRNTYCGSIPFQIKENA